MLLEMKNISKSFFGKKVLNNINFTVQPSSIHALLGENGAGKTTLMNILYGLYQGDEGDIYINKKKVYIQSPINALDFHIGMVHQHFHLVDNFSASKNITLGLKDIKGYPLINRKAINKKIEEISNKYGLPINPKKLIKDLSVGEQQRVEIMKLLYRDVELLIFDEPTAVLTPQEVMVFFDVLRQLKSQGHSIIIITHKVHEIFAISDSITVLRGGEQIISCNIDETNEDQLSEYMIGRKLETEIVRKEKNISENSCLVLNNIDYVSKGIKKLKDISLEIKKSEILGIAGVDGNGQQELAEIIAGIIKPSTGNINLDNMNITSLSINDRCIEGISYIPEDRHSDGIIGDMNLKENIFLKKYFDNYYINKGFVKEGLLTKKTNKFIEDYEIKSPGLEYPIRYLSGGNQQKLVVARELDGKIKVIIAFQPTRGLDVGATEYIHNLLFNISIDGVSILLISTDLNEIMKLSDNIAVMYDGILSEKISNNDNLDINHLGKMMAGIGITERN